jgi:hypothetical protein
MSKKRSKDESKTSSKRQRTVRHGGKTYNRRLSVAALNLVYLYLEERNHWSLVYRIFSCTKALKPFSRGHDLWAKFWEDKANRSEFPMLQQMYADHTNIHTWKYFLTLERVLNYSEFKLNYIETRHHLTPPWLQEDDQTNLTCKGCIQIVHYKKTDESNTSELSKVNIKIQGTSVCIKLKLRRGCTVSYFMVRLPMGGWIIPRIDHSTGWEHTYLHQDPVKLWLDSRDKMLSDTGEIGFLRW